MKSRVALACTSHGFPSSQDILSGDNSPSALQRRDKSPSAPQRFPLDDTERSKAVYDLRIDLVMFDGECRTNLVHLTFPRAFRPRMTDAGGNSRFPAPITYDLA